MFIHILYAYTYLYILLFWEVFKQEMTTK